MSSRLTDRIAAAEAALASHLQARTDHVTRHQNWRRRLVEAQDYADDAEEARTRQAILALMDERIRALQTDARNAERDLARLREDKADALRDPASHGLVLRIVGRWENAAPADARADELRRLAESRTRLGLVNIERRRSGPGLGFFFRWGLRGVALAGILTLFVSFGGEQSEGPFYKRISVEDGFGFVQIGRDGGGDWSLSAIETMISDVTGLPPLRQMIPGALELARAD